MSGKVDINDLLVASGPEAVRAAIEEARPVVVAQPTPTKSVRDGTSIELLQTGIARWNAPGSRFARGPATAPRFARGTVIYLRGEMAEAARAIPQFATQPALSSRFCPRWAEALAIRFMACGTGWGTAGDIKGDRVAKRHPCHGHGCPCGARRALQRIHSALSRLADVPGGRQYRLVHAVVAVGQGPRKRDMPPRHAQMLTEAQQRFGELRDCRALLGALAWQRTEALYAPWEACVVAIGVALDVDAVASGLGGWNVRNLGLVTNSQRRALAGWLGSYAALRIAPEMGVEDRARCLLDEYLNPRRGSLVFGLLHGNALRQLEHGIVDVGNARMSGPDDLKYAPAKKCLCGAVLRHEGECDPARLRKEGWTPKRRYLIAGAFGDTSAARWLTRADAKLAVDARNEIEISAGDDTQ